MILEGQYRIFLFPDADQTAFVAVAKAIEYPLSGITHTLTHNSVSVFHLTGELHPGNK